MINPSAKTPSAAGTASDVPLRKAPTTTSAITRYLAPKMLASMRNAARRPYVLWCAINLRPQTMRYDEGYKLHVGALSPSYVETTMSNTTFDSILSSGIYTETCDEVRRGLRLHRESCMKLDLTRQGGATGVPSAQQALHPGGQGSPRRHRSQQSSDSSVQRESCASGGGNGKHGSCLEPTNL